MRLLLTLALALLLLSVQAVALQAFGVVALRVEVTVLLVAFLALRATTLEGAVGAYALGYLLDMVSGRPTGLFTFLGVAVFLVGRLANSVVDVRSAGAFVLFVAGLDATHGVLAAFFTWMTSKGATASSLHTVPWQALVTALAAFCLYPLLRRMDPGSDRPAMGTLR
jgi:rod shape-determining protein MreD